MSAAGGRTRGALIGVLGLATFSCSTPKIQTDAAADALDVASVMDYKVAYVASDFGRNLHVWHSSSRAIDAYPWVYSGLSMNLTYDGTQIATATLNTVATCQVDVTDSAGNLVWSQAPTTTDAPGGCGGSVPSADANRVLVGLHRYADASAGIDYPATIDRNGVLTPVPIDSVTQCRYAPTAHVLVCLDEKVHQIITLNDDGSGVRVVVPPMNGRCIGFPAYSFDGASIVFLDGVDCGHFGIDVVDLADLTVRAIDAQMTVKSAPFLTPDGRTIVYAEANTAVNGLWLLQSVDVATGTHATLISDMGWGGYGPPTMSVGMDN